MVVLFVCSNVHATAAYLVFLFQLIADIRFNEATFIWQITQP